MLEPGVAVGRYVVRSKLTEDEVWETYLAAAEGPKGFEKEVVVKVVGGALSSDADFIQKLVAETRIASRLSHPNIVQTIDFGKHGDAYFLVLEHVHGTTLERLLGAPPDDAPLTPLLAAETCAQVARGLGFAHALTDEAGAKLGVVHRFIAPRRILLSFDGSVKLTDFGIAKAVTAHTAGGTPNPNFAYLSPEQAAGEVCDARTDVFALGAVLWELLCGRRRLGGPDATAVQRVREPVDVPPARLNPSVPVELSDAVMVALCPDPRDRFQSASELERALVSAIRKHARSIDDSSVATFLAKKFPAQANEDALAASDALPSPLGREAARERTTRIAGPSDVTQSRVSEPTGHERRAPTTEEARPGGPGRRGRTLRPAHLALLAGLTGLGALGGVGAMSWLGSGARVTRTGRQDVNGPPRASPSATLPGARLEVDAELRDGGGGAPSLAASGPSRPLAEGAPKPAETPRARPVRNKRPPRSSGVELFEEPQ